MLLLAGIEPAALIPPFLLDFEVLGWEAWAAVAVPDAVGVEAFL